MGSRVYPTTSVIGNLPLYLYWGFSLWESLCFARKWFPFPTALIRSTEVVTTLSSLVCFQLRSMEWTSGRYFYLVVLG